MIRGKDAFGNVILGITRAEYEPLILGKRCDFQSRPECGGGPHIILFFAEDDAALVKRIKEMFMGQLPPPPIDLRTKRT